MTRLSVIVKPGSKVTGIDVRDDAIVVRVRERAIEGAANEACLEALAQWLGVSPGSLRIVRGAKSRHKLIEAP